MIDSSSGSGKFVIHVDSDDDTYIVETPDGAETEEWFDQDENAFIEYDGETYVVVPDESGFKVHLLGAEQPCEEREYEGDEDEDGEEEETDIIVPD